MKARKKRIVVSVINDLVTDQRVSRTCHELHNMGFDVLLVGRKLPTSLPMPDVPYAFKRMKFLFNRGAIFYACFNFRLFWLLLFKKADMYWSNDLDTLLANYLASRIKGKEIIFDSHEYFTEVPELEHNAFAKSVWKKIEGWIVPKLKYCITVNHSIANLFKEKYNKDFWVIRNVPLKNTIQKNKTRKELGIPEDKFVVILQGSGINVDRGSEELVEAFSLLPDHFHLLIVGNGDVLPRLKKMSVELKIENKITFVNKQPYPMLVQYTMNADAGVTLDKDTNINYKFSLPNKIFDYIQCGIPVISSNLTELKKIVEEYQVGILVEAITSQSIFGSIKKLADDKMLYNNLKHNTKRAADILNWDKERNVLKSLMAALLT